jgi:hypothetical protein
VEARLALDREELEWKVSLVSGWRREGSRSDRWVEHGDSAGVVSALECMGERGRVPEGRKSRNLGRRAAAAGGPLVGRPGGVAVPVSPAVEETVETMEAGGEGVLEREGEGAGRGVKWFVELRAGMLTPLTLPAGVAAALLLPAAQITPLAFIVSLNKRVKLNNFNLKSRGNTATKPKSKANSRRQSGNGKTANATRCSSGKMQRDRRTAGQTPRQTQMFFKWTHRPMEN